jgi:uncharacterized protein
MVTFLQIKAEQLQARKDKNVIKASLLTTLIGEIQGKITAKPVAERTEAFEQESVQSRINSFLKNNRDAQRDIKDEDKIAELKTEEAILMSYMPKQVSADELRTALQVQFGEITLKNKGPAIGFLKKSFGDQVSGEVAKQVVESMVT